MNNKKAIRHLRRVNLVHFVLDHAVGKNHSHFHRISTGVAIMYAGVFLAKWLGEAEFLVVQYIGDGIGYFVHGLGAVPLIEYLVELANTEEKELVRAVAKPVVYDDIH